MRIMTSPFGPFAREWAFRIDIRTVYDRRIGFVPFVFQPCPTGAHGCVKRQVSSDLRHALQSIATGGELDEAACPSSGDAEPFGVETNRGVLAKVNVQAL